MDALAGGLEAVDAELEDVRGLVLTPDEIQSTVFGATEYQALSSQVSQTAEGLAITQNTVTDIGGRVENQESGVRVGADGIDIYRSGSAYRMHIDNAGWAITGDGQETHRRAGGARCSPTRAGQRRAHRRAHGVEGRRGRIFPLAEVLRRGICSTR